jgi:hypothetical protein
VEFGIPGMQARFPISGDGKDRSHLFAERGFAQLIGKDLPAATGQGKIAFDRTKTPRMALQGTVSGGGKPGRVVAVGRCGKVVSVARTYDAGGKERFAALVDPSIPGDCPPEARIIG